MCYWPIEVAGIASCSLHTHMMANGSLHVLCVLLPPLSCDIDKFHERESDPELVYK